MPFVTQEESKFNPASPRPIAGALSELSPEPEETLAESPSPLEAAFRRENIIGSFGAELDFKKELEEARKLGATEGFSIHEADIPDRHLGSTGLYVDVINQDEVNVITKRLDQEKADREALESTGGLGVAAMMLSIGSDPLTFVPVVTSLSFTKNLSRFSKVAALGVANTIPVAVQEGILQATQKDRTVAESALVVGASFMVGAYLGKVLTKNQELMKAHQAEIRAIVRGDNVMRSEAGKIDRKTFGAQNLGDDCP